MSSISRLSRRAAVALFGLTSAIGCGEAPDPRLPHEVAPCPRPDRTRWTPLATPGTAREVPLRAAWTGNEAVLLSHRLGEPLAGGFFEPCLSRWEPVGLRGIPTPVGHAAWIGGHLFAWGVALEPAAARYDRASRSWLASPLPLAATRAPVLGEQVVVLHDPVALGDPASSRHHAGTTYDLATGAASPIPTQGAPSPRLLAAVVPWRPTGEVLVFGGRHRDAPEALGDGAVLDMSTHRWRPLPQGAPSSRFAPVALTNASCAVIWGGRAQAPLSDGARWVPDQRRWLPIDTQDAPTWNEQGIYALTERYFVAAADGRGARYDLREGGWEHFDLPVPMVGPYVVASPLSDDTVLFRGGGARPWFWRFDPGRRTWSKIHVPHRLARVSHDRPREPATLVGGDWLLLWFGESAARSRRDGPGDDGTFIQLIGG